MVLTQLLPTLMSEGDDSTVHGANTPPETIIGNDFHDLSPRGNGLSTSSVPWPGSTYIIRSTSCGKVITLVDGQIMLASPGNRGGIHFACVENKGWLGFREVTSGKYLGHNIHGNVLCQVDRQQGWENFCVRMTPNGGYLLLMTHWERLWHVGVKMDRGIERLAKLGDKIADGKIWEFVRV